MQSSDNDQTINRKEMEEALRQSEERYHSLFKSMNEGFCLHELVTDSAGVPCNYIILDANPAWARLYGFNSADEVIGHHFTEIQKLEDVEASQALVTRIMNGDPEFCNGEFSRKCKDGGIGYHFSAAQPVVISDEVTGIEGFIVDSTARRIAEKELELQQYRTDSILTAVADTFFSLDSDWRFTVVNPASEKAPFGRPSSELLGNVIWDLYPNLLNTQFHEHCLSAAVQQSLEQFETISHLNNHWYEVFIQGYSGGVNIHMRDITKRKLAETTIIQNEARLRSLINIFQHEQNNVREMLDFSLNEAIKLTESKIGYIYFYNEDTRMFTLNTW